MYYNKHIGNNQQQYKGLYYNIYTGPNQDIYKELYYNKNKENRIYIRGEFTRKKV